MNGQLARRRSDVAHQRIGIHELRVYPVRAEALTEHAEGRIRHVFHRSKIKRTIDHLLSVG